MSPVSPRATIQDISDKSGTTTTNGSPITSAPNPASNPSLSDGLDRARIELASAAARCDLSLIADLAVGDGPYFDIPDDSLIDTLRDIDRDRPLMLQILRALQLPPREQELDGRTIYTWGIEHVTLAFDADGAWLNATLHNP